MLSPASESRCAVGAQQRRKLRRRPAQVAPPSNRYRRCYPLLPLCSSLPRSRPIQPIPPRYRQPHLSRSTIEQGTANALFASLGCFYRKDMTGMHRPAEFRLAFPSPWATLSTRSVVFRDGCFIPVGRRRRRCPPRIGASPLLWWHHASRQSFSLGSLIFMRHSRSVDDGTPGFVSPLSLPPGPPLLASDASLISLACWTTLSASGGCISLCMWLPSAAAVGSSCCSPPSWWGNIGSGREESSGTVTSNPCVIDSKRTYIRETSNNEEVDRVCFCNSGRVQGRDTFSLSGTVHDKLETKRN